MHNRGASITTHIFKVSVLVFVFSLPCDGFLNLSALIHWLRKRAAIDEAALMGQSVFLKH